LYGCRVVVADRWFPSSKTCSECGCIKTHLELSERSWQCQDCGAEHDRDLNAAKNLKMLAESSSVTACGEISAGQIRKSLTKLASVKQEPSTEVSAYG